jgi:K+-sensing histidine kinase KdpD
VVQQGTGKRDTIARPTVFHQFKRLKSGQEGFGLGLWINTAEALGHVLSVRSIVGKGSRFRVVVPLALGADEDISTASPAAAASLVVVGVRDCQVIPSHE